MLTNPGNIVRSNKSLCWLFNQLEPSKIVVGSAGGVEHAGKRLNREGVGHVVVGDGNGAPVGVFLAAVAAFGAGFVETVRFERGDEFASVYSSRNVQTVTRTAGESTSRIAASGGIGFPSWAHVVENQLDRFMDSFECLFS